MLFILSPLLLLAAVVSAAFAVRFWRADSKGSRNYAVLCGAFCGGVAGFSGVELWCGFDRACRTSQGDGMAQVMSLLIHGTGAAVVGGLVGLLVGLLAQRSLNGRRVLLVAAPVLLVSNPALSIVLALVSF